MKPSFENTGYSTDAKQCRKTGFHMVNEQTKLVFIAGEINNYILEMQDVNAVKVSNDNTIRNVYGILQST
jgi:hypothetical protein